MLILTTAPQTAVLRLLQSTAQMIGSLANRLEASLAAARETRALWQTAEELRHLDPAILDDIGVSLTPDSPDWKPIAAASPYCVAVEALDWGKARD